MNEQELIRLVKEGFEDLNQNRLDETRSRWHDDIRVTTPGAPGTINADAYAMYLQNFLTAFPDLHFTIHEVIVQGDKAAVSWSVTGHHTGPLVLPTGKTVEATNATAQNTGTNIFEVRDGKIIRLDSYWDMTSLLMQLGLLQGQASG